MERINVAVRARPLSLEDAKTSPWRITNNSIVFGTPPNKFDFDRIFREDCKTVDVYESRTKDIVSAAVGGFNGTVFAYGQTNSGKTHTMRGSSTEPGVIPLAVHDLFSMIDQVMDREFLLRMSYMEIYNEEINDLLAPDHRKLQIHESIERGIFVAGLKEEIVTSPKQVLQFMEFGEAHRHIGETNMNLHSSRSHTIFRMIIESRDKAEDEYTESSCDAVRVSVLNLVDLAGSERAAKTGAEGVRLKEGSHINKSLMTLGTVIKKLSEGAESQGGHVPYRDSKLTRILQPALGGNANTAIICNITLAQIHADETKSSLQFASRALRVTNCVHVNEILTDAALLKRQKKEIEELRAKLQGSHSDHLGEDILNLRNTLLQSELERERIALELEEEKKAQAKREKMLLEQEKKIQNLSSIVLISNRDENRDHRKKEKRRDTWCPGKVSENMANELPSVIPGQGSALRPVRTDRERGPLLPFEELVNVASCDNALPTPPFINVTSRKKSHARKRSLQTESAELREMRAEYENLLLQFESQRTTSEIQIDYLTRRLADATYTSDIDEKAIQLPTVRSLNEVETNLVIEQLQEKISMLELERSSNMQNLESAIESETEKNMRESFNCNKRLYTKLVAAQEEASLTREQLTLMISKLELERSSNLQNLESVESETEKNMHESFDCNKRLYTKLLAAEEEANLTRQQLTTMISMLESERSSNLQNLESAIESETEKNMHESLNCNKRLYTQLLAAQEEASLIRRQLTSVDETAEVLAKVSANFQEMTVEIQHSKTIVESLMDEHLQSFNALTGVIADVRSFSSIDFIQIKTLLSDYAKVCSCLKAKVSELEGEKLCMHNQSEDLQKRIEEACSNSESSSQALRELSERYEAEKTELFSEITSLQNELSRLSSSALSKEKETMRKDLEKTKSKLKETESKLRNIIQEKTKLESEKASSEREIKRLHSQKSVLERDINKRDSIAGRRRDSVMMGRSSNAFDSRRGKGSVATVDQEGYRKLEVLAFEMETTIASQEEQLAIANDEKQQADLRSESLASEVEELNERLNFSDSELQRLEELITSLRSELEEAARHNETADTCINKMVEEKEEMAMQLTDALLAIEEERAIWSTTQKTSVEAIESKAKLYATEIALLTEAMSKVRNELEACREECHAISEKLAFAEEQLEVEKACSLEKSLEIDRLKNDINLLDDQKRVTEDVRNELEVCREECHAISEKLAFAEEKLEVEKACSVKKSIEIERLKNDINLLDDQKRVTEDALKSKLESVSSNYRNACEEVDKLRMDLDALSKERDELEVKVKESGQISVSMDDIQNLRDQLLNIKNERDAVIARAEELQNQKAEQQLRMQRYNDKLVDAKVDVKELTMKLSTLEVKMHNDGVKNSIQTAKLRMRLNGAQTKLDSIRIKCKEEVLDKEFMHNQFADAAKKLKTQLGLQGSEILNLKKQLALKG